MMGRSVNPVSNRSKADTWANSFPKRAVLIGDREFIREAETYFSAHVREVGLTILPAEAGDENALPPGFPIQGPWCLVCDLVTSSRSLRLARKILLNTSDVPFIALASDPADLPEADLRVILELGITHVLPVPGSWQEAWSDIKRIIARRLNPLLSVHSTKMWLVGVLQSVATQEKNCCVRISSRNHLKARTASRDHGTSLRISPVGLLGEIYFHEGQPLYAWSTRLQGDEAVIDLLQTSNIQISVLESGWMPPIRNVHQPLQGVLLEFMRRKDLGQLEPPSSVLSPDDLQGRDSGIPGAPSTRRVAAAVSPSRPARSKRFSPLLGAAAAAVLVVLLALVLKWPAAPAARIERDPPPLPRKAKEERGAPVAGVPPPAPARVPEKPRVEEVQRPERPRELTLSIGERATIDAVLIPAGRFRMGSPESERGRDADEGPLRDVTFPAPFYMGKYEVTQEQYQAVMGENPSQFRGPRHPVESVSSFEAQEFCERASKRAGRGFRLPTEAEWEYACRAGSTSPFHGGESLHAADANIDGRVGYGGSGDGVYRGTMMDVGSFTPNAFGLYDMHGNVGEWCADFYDPRGYDVASAAAVPFSPGRPDRVWRGGAYNDPPRRCRSAHREHYNPGGRDSCRGFRVVIAIEVAPGPPEQH
ncbi:MAG TPA: SUMF1/EgtB/PvdO family nonheme iron enzyme [Planctomycetota bacterium]|nr:SUMF1/EgtB/PvdO family nonheme iron enzyme [Planctomycetota bacterium]